MPMDRPPNHSVEQEEYRRKTAERAERRKKQRMQRIIILGVIDAATKNVMLEPIYVLPDQEEATNHQAGDHTIVLRNGSGDELLRYPFSPTLPSYIDPVNRREVSRGCDAARACPR